MLYYAYEFPGFLWYVAYVHISCEACVSHPRLMESDDVVAVVCTAAVIVVFFLCMSELDRTGVSLNALCLSLSLMIMVSIHPSIGSTFLCVRAKHANLLWRSARFLWGLEYKQWKKYTMRAEINSNDFGVFGIN